MASQLQEAEEEPKRMAAKPQLSQARQDLLWSRRYALLSFALIIHPLYAILDWAAFPKVQNPPVWVIRLLTTAVSGFLGGLCWTRWGRQRILMLCSAAFLAASAGFQVIIYHAAAFDSSYAADYEPFFGAYCLLIPATTLQAGLVGITMAIMPVITGLIAHHPANYVDLALDTLPFFVIFLLGRHIANQLWEKEFLTREELTSTVRELQGTQESLMQSERMAAIGRVTAEIAHELRNPLSLITLNVTPMERAAARLAKESPGDTNIQDMVEGLNLIRSGAERAASVISALREFGSLAGQQFAPVDISAIVGISVSLTSTRARQKNITIHCEYEEIPRVLCRAYALSQVLVNLLQNACDAVSPQGNIWVRTARPALDTVSITIQDDGPGIPAHLLPAIFEPFVTTKEKRSGMGLGLAISRRIVQEHGGTIAIGNEAPGAKVVIHLPLQPSENTAVAAAP